MSPPFALFGLFFIGFAIYQMVNTSRKASSLADARQRWQYERGKGRFPMGNVSFYLGLGLLLGVLWYTPRILGVAAAETDLTRNLLLAFGWSVAFHHYLMDSRIWRVRRQPAVARALDRGAH